MLNVRRVNAMLNLRRINAMLNLRIVQIRSFSSKEISDDEKVARELQNKEKKDGFTNKETDGFKIPRAPTLAEIFRQNKEEKDGFKNKETDGFKNEEKKDGFNNKETDGFKIQDKKTWFTGKDWIKIPRGRQILIEMLSSDQQVPEKKPVEHQEEDTLDMLKNLEGILDDDKVTHDVLDSKEIPDDEKVAYEILGPAVAAVTTLEKMGLLDKHGFKNPTAPMKVENPIEEDRACILQIHSRVLNVHPDVNFEELARSTDGFNGTQLEAVCMLAHLIGEAPLGPEDFTKAIHGIRFMIKKKYL